MTIFLVLEYIYPDAPGERPARAFTSRADADAAKARCYYGARVVEIPLD